MDTKEVRNGLTGGMRFLVIIGVFALPIFLANVLSKTFRLPDHVWRFFFVLFAITAGAAATYLGWPPKLGVDLRGGINLVYEISQKPGVGSEPVDMEKLIGTINRRINPGGIKEVTVRPFGLDKIEIIIPGADQDELARIKELIYKSGALEFRILASRHKYQNEIDAALGQQRRQEARKEPLTDVVFSDAKGTPVEIARWFSVDVTREGQFRGIPEYATREVPAETADRNLLQVLCIRDPYKVTGDYLVNASPGLDEGGRPCVVFSFNGEGANRMLQLTSTHLPDQAGQTSELGIVLDNFLQSAPQIRGAIGDRGEITGNFTKEETKSLSEILTAGALPATLDREPISEVLIGPMLGEDTIKAGVTSMAVAVGVVVAFMLVYYRFAGVVANIALLLNVLLTVAFMVMFNAAFTLSGLAGLALTVGMAVDANVLIYERMREELNRGATIRMAIRNGFDRASVTIIDANVTTLITAVVLYIIGTDQIKGFAVALTVGLCWNLFTAITVSRLIFDVAEKARWIGKLKFMQLMTTTNYDFIGKRYICYTGSILILGAGLIGIVVRGSSLLNIDFTGGTSITTVFENPPADGIAHVREGVEKALPEATVQQLDIPGEVKGTGFKIVTSDPNTDAVENKIKELFGKDLAKFKLTYGELGTIAAANGTTPAVTGPSLTAPAAPAPTDGSSLEEPSRLDLSEDEELLASACDPVTTPAAPATTATPTATASATAAAPKPTASPSATPAATPSATAAPAPAATPTPSAAAAPTPSTTASPTPSATATGTANAFGGAALGLPSTAEIEAALDPYAGGTFVTLKFDPPMSEPKLSELLKKIVQPDANLPGTLYQLSALGHIRGSSKPQPEWDLRIAAPADKTREVLTKLEAQLADAPFFPSSEEVGAAVADSAQQSALVAMALSLALVLAYIWFRFQNLAFGLAAIVALAHDVLFTLGCLALSLWLAPVLGFAMVEPFKIDLTIVAAILTIIGYSLNDTIVIFDRIREVRGKSSNITAGLINDCVNQTLSRTILTSLTVFMVVVILYIWGGPGIHGFAFALVVGTISGTYSTIYVASPVLLWLHERSKAKAIAASAAARA